MPAKGLAWQCMCETDIYSGYSPDKRHMREAKETAMSQTSPPHNTSDARTGGVSAGRNIKAENIVIGVQVQGADADTARALLALARDFQHTGSVEAVQDIMAKNLVTGLQYIGQGGSTPDREQFRQELTAVRAQLTQAVQAGEIEGTYDAEDAQKAVDRAIEQTQAEQPVAEKITTQIERATTIVDKAAVMAESIGKFQAVVIKLAPALAALKQLAGFLWPA